MKHEVNTNKCYGICTSYICSAAHVNVIHVKQQISRYKLWMRRRHLNLADDEFRASLLVPAYPSFEYPQEGAKSGAAVSLPEKDTGKVLLLFMLSVCKYILGLTPFLNRL